MMMSVRADSWSVGHGLWVKWVTWVISQYLSPIWPINRWL